MSEKRFVLTRAHLLLIVLAGTVVRLLFGLYSKGWLMAPDQLAWQLTLDAIKATGFSYASLNTYPHEGGSFLVGLLGLAVAPLSRSGLPALSIAGLLIDTACRLVQIHVANKVFGGATAAWFGAWTILSVPLLLPWGTLVFALHPVAAVFPFLLLLVLSKSSSPVVAGIFCAAAMSVSYDCIILLPVAAVLCLFRDKSLATPLKFAGAFALGMIPHLLLRTVVDNAFVLRDFGLFAIRSSNWQDTFTLDKFKQLSDMATAVLPNSLFVGASAAPNSEITRVLVLALLAIGVGCCFTRSKQVLGVTLAAVGLVLVFIMSYSLSPFFVKLPIRQHYIFYRHITFIAPLLSLLVFQGLTRFRWTRPLAGAWLALSLVFSVSYIWNAKPAQSPSYIDAGWILAQKFGERPAMLTAFHDVAPVANRADLLKGYGWGITTALLKERPPEDTRNVPEVLRLVRQLPGEYQDDLIGGVRFAFGGRLTPWIDPAFLKLIEGDLASTPLH